MRRSARLATLALLLVLVGCTSSDDSGAPAEAKGLANPEPGRPDFALIFNNLDASQNVSTVWFDTTTGWDFGDRGAYRCAWVEHYTHGKLDFRIAFNRFNDAPYMQVNDRRGPESSNDCVNQDTGHRESWRSASVAYEGEDHFPHLIHQGDGLTFYRNGEPFEYLDLTAHQCADGYWVPGDEAGEAILWWDPDGPTSSHRHQHNDLLCGGGPEEPLPVINAKVVRVADGIHVSTRGHDR